jgi:hypothetical protein
MPTRSQVWGPPDSAGRPRGRPRSTAEPRAAASTLLRVTMASRGFDRRRLARALSVDVRTVARWMAEADRGPDRRDAVRLGDLLGEPGLYRAWWPGEEQPGTVTAAGQRHCHDEPPGSPSAVTHRRTINDLIASWGALDDCRGHAHTDRRAHAVYALSARAHDLARACNHLWDHGFVTESLPSVRACFESAILAGRLQRDGGRTELAPPPQSENRRLAEVRRRLAADDRGPTRHLAVASSCVSTLAACTVSHSLIWAEWAFAHITPIRPDDHHLTADVLRLGTDGGIDDPAQRRCHVGDLLGHPLRHLA